MIFRFQFSGLLGFRFHAADDDDDDDDDDDAGGGGGDDGGDHDDAISHRNTLPLCLDVVQMIAVQRGFKRDDWSVSQR